MKFSQLLIEKDKQIAILNKDLTDMISSFELIKNQS